jgi:smad nuclear-interacting protein 1
MKRSRSRSKERPNFKPSGILARYQNHREGVPLVYTEPSNSAEPQSLWRLHVYRDRDELEPIDLTKSWTLFGRAEDICDQVQGHPSISKQHAVIQFRSQKDAVKPYLIDLNSTNGTTLNGVQIESSRYYELRHTDILRFGKSKREYVLTALDSIME